MRKERRSLIEKNQIHIITFQDFIRSVIRRTRYLKGSPPHHFLGNENRDIHVTVPTRSAGGH